MLPLITQLAGVLLILAVLLDIFLTVLYARMGTGFISQRLFRWIWWVFKAAARGMSRYGDKVLSFAGPVSLGALVSVWAAGLIVGGGW